jgi:hypothetical protein
MMSTNGGKSNISPRSAHQHQHQHQLLPIFHGVSLDFRLAFGVLFVGRFFPQQPYQIVFVVSTWIMLGAEQSTSLMAWDSHGWPDHKWLYVRS